MVAAPAPSATSAPAHTPVAPFALLAARGIAPATLAAFGLVATAHYGPANRPAVRYPVRLPDGTAVGRRVKYMDGYKPKAGWICPPGQHTAGDLAPATLYGADLLPRRLTSLFLAEGEPDVWLLHSLGLPAASLLRGAGAGVPDHARYALAQLAPARVYIVYDHDADGTGQRGAWHVADDLRGVVGEILPLALPAALGDGGDVTDLYARCGQERARFVAALAGLPSLVRPPERRRRDRSAATRRADGAGGGEYADYKRAHPLVPFVEQVAGRPGRQAGHELVWRCILPGHDDQTPSFYVHPDKGLFLCRGCGRGGDIITLMALLGRPAELGRSA